MAGSKRKAKILPPEDLGHWLFPVPIVADKWFGFIYRITDLVNNKEYIGKKQFHSYSKVKVKGKTRRKSVIKESKWRAYTSSSKIINELIQEHGKERFRFEIESLHETRASLSYAELESQIIDDVLRARDDNNERRFYNGMVGNIKYIPPGTTDNESLHRIVGLNKSRTPELIDKDLILEEHYKPAVVDIEPEPVKPKAKAKVKPKARPKKATKSKSKTVTCPHCKKEGAPGPMKRYHFDKCKLK